MSGMGRGPVGLSAHLSPWPIPLSGHMAPVKVTFHPLHGVCFIASSLVLGTAGMGPGVRDVAGMFVVRSHEG